MAKDIDERVKKRRKIFNAIESILLDKREMQKNI